MAWGEYPAEYNVKVHGPYYPFRFYGKPDTPFGQVKLGELTQWFGRRNKGPVAIGQAMGRAFHSWHFQFFHPRKVGIQGYMQAIAGAMIFFYVINYPKYKRHRFYKYHW